MDIKINNFNNFIKDIIDYNDNINLKYFKYINYKYYVDNNYNIEDHIGINNNDNTNSSIIFYINNEKKYSDFEILGIYDNINNIWIWGWVLPAINNKYIINSKYLLEYGLKIDINNIPELLFIKTLLTNSRILIGSSIELEINMAIILYLLKNKILFIYKYKNKNITSYYLIKNLY